MTSIVEDLLLLARSDSGAVELEHVPVDLGDVAADGASALGKPATDRGVRVEVDPQPAVVSGDPARLRQLVMILVDNAIRHSPIDGRVGVAVRADGGGGVAHRRGRRTRHPARGPAAPVRAVLPGARRAGRRDRARPGDRGLDRGSTRRRDRGRQSGRGRRALRRAPAGHHGDRGRLTGGPGRSRLSVSPRGPGSAPSPGSRRARSSARDRVALRSRGAHASQRRPSRPITKRAVA